MDFEEGLLFSDQMDEILQVDFQNIPNLDCNLPVYPQQLITLTSSNINKGKTVISFEDDERNEQENPFRRVKWSDDMVKFLITALSYLSNNTSPDFVGGKTRESAIIAKKGKWRAISQILTERGFIVTPQKCEDKFNDLNKKYKRLVEILGRGISCNVVENPYMLEFMDISENLKDEVRKLLSVKQLFYREMCSFHNGNRLFLPHDETIKKSLKLIMGKQNADKGNLVNSLKRKKEGEDGVMSEGSGKDDAAKKHRINAKPIELEKLKFKIQKQMAELKMEELKLRHYCKNRDMLLDKLRSDNTILEVENARLSLQLRRLEMRNGNI